MCGTDSRVYMGYCTIYQGDCSVLLDTLCLLAKEEFFLWVFSFVFF